MHDLILLHSCCTYSTEITHIKNIPSGKVSYRVCLTDKMIAVKQRNYNSRGVKGGSVATTALRCV